jgi:hypothetical protein
MSERRREWRGPFPFARVEAARRGRLAPRRTKTKLAAVSASPVGRRGRLRRTNAVIPTPAELHGPPWGLFYGLLGCASFSHLKARIKSAGAFRCSGLSRMKYGIVR